MGSFLLVPCEPRTRNSRLSSRVSCSQQPSPGAGSCHPSVGAWGWIDAVRERSTAEPSAGWTGGAAGTPGAPVLPSLALHPQNGSSGLPTPQKGGWGHPCFQQLPCSPWHHCHPPGQGGLEGDHPIRHGVSSTLPRVTRGLWVCRGGFDPTWSSPWNPSTATTAQGRQRRCHSQGEDTAGVTATPAQGGQCQGYSPGLPATPVPGPPPHLCRGTNARVTATRVWGG